MARIDIIEQKARKMGSVRLLNILLLLSLMTGGMLYFFSVPLHQLYWGMKARVKPMLSEADLMRKGRPIPGKYPLKFQITTIIAPTFLD